MKNVIGYIVIGLLALVGVIEVVVLGKAICRHATEPKQEATEKANYHDAAVVIGEYMILQHNGWTPTKRLV